LFPACRSTLKIIYHGTQALEKKSEVFLLKFKIKFYIILTELSSLFEMKVNLELESFAWIVDQSKFVSLYEKPCIS